ncbi:hypothetical protein BDZ97DRAFT_121145 [Flammula alnicola]|nr:hypothetical protein BDZ97DRAFT_121145 [Flammula alnicola]
MLFSGLACFSPSVPQAIRKLWGTLRFRLCTRIFKQAHSVMNGGTLTHTDADFRQAVFFFCNGMEDPWLNELLSRSLIVRHASWVTLCVVEDFHMPIAAYTLDDGFDESRIRILDPSVPDTARRKICGLPYNKPIPALSVKPVLDSLNHATHKRPFESEGDSRLQAIQRPKKRARIQAAASEPGPKGRQLIGANANASVDQSQKPSIHIAEDEPALRKVSFPSKTYHRHGKVSKAVKMFETCVVHPKTLSPLPTPKKQNKIRSDPLNPHTLFWKDLFAKCYPRDGSATLNLAVDDLLQAPRTKAAIFDVNETYLGRRFINLEYA